MQLFYYYAVRDLCPSSASSQIQGISVGISADLEKDKVESRCPLLEPQNNCLMVKKGDRFTLIPRPEEKWIYVQRVDDSTTVDKDSNATDPSSVSINTCSCDSGNLEHCDRSLLCDNEFERGFVSLDCLDIIEVSHNLTKNETFPKEEYLGNLEVKGDKMDVDDIVQKLRDQCQTLEEQLQRTKDELRDALSDNKTLNKRCLKLTRYYEEAREELKEIKICSEKEEDHVSFAFQSNDRVDMCQSSGQRSEIDQKLANGKDMLASCTLCSKDIRVGELKTQSKSCSVETISQPPTPTLPNVLISTVTRVTPDPNADPSCLLRVVTKDCCPERIVPPLVLQESESGTLREVQRFLRRLCSHKVLKFHEWVRIFLSESKKAFEKKKQVHEKIKLKKTNLVQRKPSCEEPEDEENLLIRTQVYISNLKNNIQKLISCLKDGVNNNSSGYTFEVFDAIGEGEINDTYLKEVAGVLYRVERENVKQKADSEELLLVENLESLLEYIKCADKLLSRVEGRINTFLYWEEQMKLFEQSNTYGTGKGTSGTSTTQKWAEASANCNTAKHNLEVICKDLSTELHDFDLKKEHEMKEILMDFAEGRYEYFEKATSGPLRSLMLNDSDTSVFGEENELGDDSPSFYQQTSRAQFL